MVVSNETAREIIEAATFRGERVAIVVPSIQRGRELLIDLVDAVEFPLSTYQVYTSKLEIRFGVGRITIHSIRSSSSLRGLSLDRLYLEHGVDDEDVLAAIMPTLNARGGELVRY
jgi:hypothetical protein